MLVRYWWLIALVGIIAMSVGIYSYKSKNASTYEETVERLGGSGEFEEPDEEDIKEFLDKKK